MNNTEYYDAAEKRIKKLTITSHCSLFGRLRKREPVSIPVCGVFTGSFFEGVEMIINV